uniref:hypothetical protein n=1 Tax=Paractinoplanes polyasparticus TaxID=2856853 RepID=UPI001C84FD5B
MLLALIGKDKFGMIKSRWGRAFIGPVRENVCMRQLQLFNTVELAKMRDRTKARNWSPAGDEFRREHERHRAWGLQQRHAAKAAYLRRARRAAEPRDLSASTPIPADPPEIP